MLPRTLKNMNVFVKNLSYAGIAETITLPKIKKKTEDYRGAGMIGDVALTFGYEKFEAAISYAGFDPSLLNQLAVCGVGDLPLRFVGVYERQDTCTNMAVEWYMRGQAIGFDPNDAILGKKSEMKLDYNVSYCRLVVDGLLIFEIDLVNGIDNWGGNDLVATVMALLGL